MCVYADKQSSPMWWFSGMCLCWCIHLAVCMHKGLYKVKSRDENFLSVLEKTVYHFKLVQLRENEVSGNNRQGL